ncbi:MAG: type II secretion system F family protein [Oscillospiraceae bacterium]|jgi:type IV pilus assembly protein PilC|nr:type II secretion system F family protein [Oscillospiraceae bacterium]
MKQFSLQYISSFCMSLHLAMQAGIPIPEGVTMFQDEETDAARRGRIAAVTEKLELGEQLSAALRYAAAFPDYLIDMVEVGEKTGKLDDTLLALSRYYDRQESISKSIRSAVTYPVMLLAVLLLVLIIFVVKILPIFYDVYQQLGASMSGPATAALNFGAWLSDNWIAIVVVIAILAALAVVFRAKLRGVLKRVFMGGALGAAMLAARFSSILSMTLSSGMDTDEALTMAARLTEDKTAAARISESAKNAELGTSFAQCVADTGIFSTLYNRMLSIGVKTGSSDTVMEEISRRSGDDANDKLEAFIGKIEPSLVIIMSVLVGLLLLSVMLPLAGIMSAI